MAVFLTPDIQPRAERSWIEGLTMLFKRVLEQVSDAVCGTVIILHPSNLQQKGKATKIIFNFYSLCFHSI